MKQLSQEKNHEPFNNTPHAFNLNSLPVPNPPSPQKSAEKESRNIGEISDLKPEDHNETFKEQKDSRVHNNGRHYPSPPPPEYYDPHTQRYDSFQCTYRCSSFSVTGKSHLEQGNQIIMPASAFEFLLDTRIEYPMLFEIRNKSKERVSHCGVYEFTAEEGSVFLPDWMMENLQLQDGDVVTLKNATLEKGTFIKLQPHSTDFLSIVNPKAALEEALSANIFCLTNGDTIKINYNNKEFRVNIVETKPSNAICIIDTDCEVDFVPPLDYQEPEQTTIEEPRKEGQKFMPFTGLHRRLDEKPAAEVPGPDSGSVKEESQANSTAPSKANSSDSKTYKHPANMVFGSAAHGNRLKKLKREDIKPETPEKEQFQPFTGKKYSLEG